MTGLDWVVWITYTMLAIGGCIFASWFGDWVGGIVVGFLLGVVAMSIYAFLR